MILLLIAAATRPALRDDGIGGRPTPLAGTDLNVFVVDRSVSQRGCRGLRCRRTAVRGDARRHRGCDHAVPGGAVRARRLAAHPSLDWPLSGDVWSLQPVLRGSEHRPDPGLGESSCRGRQRVALSADPGGAAIPGFEERRAVLRFGATSPSHLPGRFELRHGSVDGGAVLVYGRSDAINDAELRRNAEELGVPYLQRDPGQPFRLELPSAPIAGRGRQTDRNILAAGAACGRTYYSPKSTCQCASSVAVASHDGT